MSSLPEVIDAEHRVTGSEIVPMKVAQPVAPVPRYFQDISPAEQVQYAVDVANALKPIIDAKGLAHKLNKKNPNDEYVELEAWQTCGKLCGMSAKVEWVKTIDKGYESRAVVIRVDTGLEIGAGESRCTRDEYNWKGRDDYAVSGMAQTRAQSRALRGQLAWILVLAGYKATPSEEMPDTTPTMPAAKPIPPPRDEDTPEARAAGIKAVHALARKHNVDLDSPASPYRKILIEHFDIFCDPEVEVSSKALTAPELRELYRLVTEHIRERDKAGAA